jgi:hypothetical protein
MTTDPMPYPTQFSWPMRVFLSFMVFWIVFRSLSVLIPWEDWAREEFEMRRKPVRLPTPAEIRDLAAKANEENSAPVFAEVMRSVDSFWLFLQPWPDASVRAKIHSPGDLGRWSLCWANSRLDFVESVVGFNQEWPMFSPNVGKRRSLARARLIFTDGQEQIVRLLADPKDLTNYSHWFQEKILDYELKITDDANAGDECFGYCNLLMHRHASNDKGAKLKEIRLFMVRYEFCPPGENPTAWYQAQTGPPADQVGPDFYLFNVETRNGRAIESK